mmetsp:Transcript_13381/g.24017  ORF Transcript_13381/g.24017 Transcript_13381/m.24017 type:complete len:221 (-) Transcript_13381:66-728(-)|eukprot:CAMPEP_0182442664 /NCGR_PEP_ID=MMETSP1172-20130603/1571_1 /TAXON_ID=708627 /ORGANISM="Timspurckia oligopyrenoides, Strain CCMP3278" /LENGTH=220 /DNA_ID=CAMNT_0024637653 /DNA_START=74 /DNA_END=736 /DNA_ORIENTATION=-
MAAFINGGIGLGWNNYHSKNRVVCSKEHSRSVVSSRNGLITMVSPAALEKKQNVVTEVKDMLDEATIIFSVPLSTLTMKNLTTLKNSIPESTKVRCVKNTLMRRAIEESQWGVIEPITVGHNMWFFVKEDVKDTVTALNKFLKDTKKTETNAIGGGAFDGILYDSKGIEAVSKMPSKQELYQQIAVGIKMVPTKLGRVTKAVPAKLARAIKLAIADDSAE